jgi:alkylation response protein AidB-like acyl-CoA dehydrogenase
MATVAAAGTNVWVEKARALAPVITAHRDEGERERHLPDPVYEAIRDAGLYWVMLPKVYGGPGGNLEDGLLAIEEISRQDGATGWNLMIGMQGVLFADYLPEKAAQEIYGGGQSFVAGSLGPTGQALPVEGGYRLGGRWPFASGCRHASWLMCGGMIFDDGAPRMNEDGSPQMRLFVVPAAGATILDTWHTGGLRGTGSNDFELKDVFVPEERSFPFRLLTLGPQTRPNLGFTQPFMVAAAPSMAAVALGIARDAIDALKELAAEKTPSGSMSKLATIPTAHERVGSAEALLGSARAYLLDANAQLMVSAQPSPELFALVRLASAHAVRAAGEAVDLMYDLGGGTAVYNSSRLDRCFRDVHTASHHTLISSANMELIGRYYLGGPLVMRR